jgi:hypothetical protein
MICIIKSNDGKKNNLQSENTFYNHTSYTALLSERLQM